MEWDLFLNWAFEGLLAGCAIYGANTMRELCKSVEKLNSQMAAIIERDVWHTKWLEKHDDEIERLRHSSDTRSS